MFLLRECVRLCEKVSAQGTGEGTLRESHDCVRVDGMNTMNHPLSIGIRAPHQLFENASALRAFASEVTDRGIDRLCVGDHVTFRGGAGFDGLMQSSMLAALTDLEIQTAVYLLPLRHPVPVTRQAIALAQIAPGRFVFGVGVGGDDPEEVKACGVDPSTRGRRMDESLTVIRQLLAGKTLTHHGDFFDLDEVCMAPTPLPAIPIVIGGRADAALRRAGRLGDGYLAVWVSPERFAAATASVAQYATEAGRENVAWRHGLQVWCGFDSDKSKARAMLGAAMEDLYRIPFEKFEKWSPYGTPAEVAAFLAPYLEHGCGDINIIPVADSPRAATDAVAEVAALLRA